ncbi:phosphatidylinositol N-acetylglucosaminyltransferase subunit C-like [Symsagittifera roscoffensis]|uniref:phosphatidylinositol N-acetylglucosaminyltransferase subunit C-like n=1 Tax=Symsagittifera roscoffensis TaxID=84072 RepID=UPI00307CAA5E
MRMTRRSGKILYVKNDEPDNYIGPSFLQELKKNVNIKLYDFVTVSETSSYIAQHVSFVLLEIGIFVLFSHERLSPLPVLMFLMCGVGFCYLIYHLYLEESCCDSKPSTTKTVVNDLRRASLLASLVFILSPVLNTLTAEISSDTIYALSTLCFLLNVLFHNYGTYSSLLFSPISLNCGIFVSVLLASRLDGTAHTFTMVIQAFVFFAYAPKFTERMRDKYPLKTVYANILITIFVTIAFAFISLVAFCLIFLLFISILLLLPYVFVRMQKMKNTIHGPWDEAVLAVD